MASPWSFIVTCLPYKAIISRGVWLGDNPFYFSSPTFMLQVGLSSLFTGTFDFLLRPFGACSFFSNMIGALALGPSGVLRIKSVSQLVFSMESLYVFETFANFGLMFFLFLVGIKMDMGIVRKSGRKCVIIGISSFIFPMFMVLPVAAVMRFIYVETHPKIANMFGNIAFSSCEVSFHVIACLLADLKLLNTELGRLAMSTSMVTNGIIMFIVSIFKAVNEYSDSDSAMMVFILKMSSLVVLILVVVFLMRPVMLWMIHKTPEGSNVREVYVFVIFLMLLFTSLFGQAAGQPMHFGPIILGLVVPVGPPLGTTIEQKLESVVQSFLLPVFYVASVGRMRLWEVTYTNTIFVLIFMLVTFLGKLIGTVLSSLYCEMNLQDALTLGLMMVSQGLVDVIHFSRILVYELIDNEVYSIMTCTVVMLSGITSPMLKYLYKPSERYLKYRRSIQQDMKNSEFCILACVYYQSTAPTIINLLQASNPISTSPICLYLLHLIELQRVSTPILIAHKKDDDNSIHFNRSKRIINAFKYLEEQNMYTFSLNSYTSMSPYATMHDDICSLATDKRTSLIILPFHRYINEDGLFESTNAIRNVNQTVLRISPCTVGILVDRGKTGINSYKGGTKSAFHVAILFLGGEDDREVLTYGMRMADYPYTVLTVIHFHPLDEIDPYLNPDSELDEDLIQHFRLKMNVNEKIHYREEVVSDGIGIIKCLKLMDDSYDLIMVGRQHETGSPLVHGLTDWNEFPELGCIGDILATSDSLNSVSILVMQQRFVSEILQPPSVVLTL